jgi:hypothetical protein
VFITGGRMPGIKSSLALARLSLFTNLGSVSGPPLIGLASSLFKDLRYAFLILLGLLSLIILCSAGVENKDETPENVQHSHNIDSEETHDQPFYESLENPLIQHIH